MFTSSTIRDRGFSFVNIFLSLFVGSLFVSNSWAQEPFPLPDTLVKTFNGQQVLFPLDYEQDGSRAYVGCGPFVEHDTTFIYREYEYHRCDTCSNYHCDVSSYYILSHLWDNHRENVSKISCRRFWPFDSLQDLGEDYYRLYKMMAPKMVAQSLGDFPRIWYPLEKYNGSYYFSVDNAFTMEFCDSLIIHYGYEPYFSTLIDFKKMEGGGWTYQSENWIGEVYEDTLVPCANVKGAYVLMESDQYGERFYSLWTNDQNIDHFDLIGWESYRHRGPGLNQYENIYFKGNEVITPTNLEDAEIEKLIACIPDHTLDQSPAEAFTKTYYSLLTEAWDIPSDNPGGIGSDEWLNYFLTGNGGGSCAPRDLHFHQNGQYARVVFVCDSVSPEPVSNEHTVDFQFDGIRWVIADFDETSQKLYSYIQTMRNYFRSDEWTEDLKKMRHLTSKERKKAQQRVAEYFAKYLQDR